MNKAVMISIKPLWCDLIANGKKTIEVRKTAPKLSTPFKCYIYCTKDVHWALLKNTFGLTSIRCINSNAAMAVGGMKVNGKVIGEFICNEIESFTTDYRSNEKQNERISEQSCLNLIELSEYEQNSNCLFGWHISNLVIYDEPKEINLFLKEDFEQIYSNWEDMFGIGVSGCGSVEYSPEPKVEDYLLKRPPQSWCYVEV